MNWVNPLVGGILIGLSVTWMLLSTGRVTGISGILSSTLMKGDKNLWRVLFLLGLVSGGVLLKIQNPEFFLNTTERGFPILIVAGFLVGFGTVLANGCTSGHGICGLSRLSFRSLVATMTFMFFGALTVFLYSRFL